MKKLVVLFNPPLYFSEGLPRSLDTSVPPLGLLYLASYINRHSKLFTAHVFDIAAEKKPLTNLIEELSKSPPFAVGISAMTPQLQGTIELAGMIKRTCPDLPIFLGGPHISADPGFLRRFNRFFDYGICGEAEITFCESLEKLFAGKKIPRLQTAEPITDLNRLPFPDRTLLFRQNYGPCESMLFSRGCPFSCYYCSRPAIAKTVRYRSAKNMVEEIKVCFPGGRGKIDFQDDTFTLDRSRVLELCREIKNRGLRLSWRCNSRIDLVDEELLKKMKEAGCDLIHFGVEAGNEKIRKEVVRKGNFTNKEIRRVFSLCRKIGIKTGAYFILGHPGETEKNLLETEKLIFSLAPNLLGLSLPTPFPGSRLYELAKEEGIINETIINKFGRKELGEGYAGVYPVFTSEKVSREKIYSLMKSINRRFYLNKEVLLQRLKEDIVSFPRLKRDLSDFFSLVLKGVSSRKPYVNKQGTDGVMGLDYKYITAVVGKGLKKIQCLYFYLIDTGERLPLKKRFEEIGSEHQFIYKLAGRYAKNKSVLDFGCGGGYGTEYLSRFTSKTVTGYDVDENTIKITSGFFRKVNLKFTGDCRKLKKTDLVVMSQVLEHLKKNERDLILDEISKKLLKKGGCFICSTPNKLVTSRGLKKPIMVFHEFEYTSKSLKNELSGHYGKVDILGQYEIKSNKRQRTRTGKVRQEVTRFLSQIEIVRFISRYLPMGVKRLLMGSLPKTATRKYVSVRNPDMVNKSFTLIALCKK